MDSIYKSINPIAVRVALEEINTYDELFTQDEGFVVNDSFKEAILAASTTLFHSLGRKNKKYDHIKRSVLKYQIRNITRCTPYGLFTGIGMVHFADHTELDLNSGNIDKRARIDMKWLFKYIDYLLQDDTILCHMRVKRNHICYKSGDRFINPYFSAGGKAEGNESICFSIRYTKPVEYVLKLCNEYLSFHEIVKELTETFHITKEKAKSFLDELIHHEFLLMELFPPLINTDPLKYLINILEKYLGVTAKSVVYLHELDKKIQEYNQSTIGNGIPKFHEITEFMKAEVECSHYLQIDAKINVSGEKISAKVGQELEKTVNFLSALAAGYSEQEYIIKYKDDFLEKYGYNTEVSILEMLDHNIGIGTPANYKNSQRSYIDYIIDNELLNKLNRIIVNKGIHAIKNGTDIVVLDDDDMSEVCEGHTISYDYIQNTIEIFAQLLAESTKKIDEGEFSILLSGCISSAGGLNSLGRFSDLFWEDTKYDMESKSCEETLLGEHYVIAELVEKFRTGRTANVDMNMNSFDYQICIGCNACEDKHVIELDDIYIGVDQGTNQFYAKSHKLNKRIYARTTHMLNNFFGSDPFRFLRDISSLAAKFHFGEIVVSLGNNNFEYFPRIIYGNTILRPARWKYANAKTKNFDEWKVKFLKWIREHNVPDCVNYIKSDNFLRLDFNKNECLELLYYDSLKEEVIILNEDFAVDKNLWLKDTNGNKHCCEMVITLAKNSFESNAKIKTDLASEKPYFFHESERILFPGEDGWYYYKLYGMAERENEFIGIDLKKIVDELLKLNVIDKHFFIRYSDTRPHVRIRLHVCAGMHEQFNNKFNKWLILERERGIVTDLNIAVYEREMERYGGKNLIAFAEDVFHADSLFIENLREALYYKDLTLTDEEIAVWSIWGLLNAFGMNMEEAENWMSSFIKRNEHREIFKEREKEFRMSLYLGKKNIPLPVLEAYEHRNQYVQHYYIQTVKNKMEGSISNTSDDILSSFIHMFCNRYMADNTWERKMRALTRHTLYAELSYERFRKD